ncbi:MAG TPA: DUF2795 domain-containing protein [Gaiellaceae bacterium]|nr:DUF2795 domain-containing protein [Gaiellaceae bacterium]
MTRAELEVLLEGVDLPAPRRELIRHALGEAGGEEAAALLRALPDREYRSIDEVGEALEPVQPQPAAAIPTPRPESGDPPGGDRYTAQ